MKLLPRKLIVPLIISLLSIYSYSGEASAQPGLRQARRLSQVNFDKSIPVVPERTPTTTPTPPAVDASAHKQPPSDIAVLAAIAARQQARAQLGDSADITIAPPHSRQKDSVRPPSAPSAGRQEKKAAAPAVSNTVSDNRETISVPFRDIAGTLPQSALAPSTDRLAADAGDADVITGIRRWGHDMHATCSEPGTAQARATKADALREMFYRYSGSNDLYDSLIQAACSKKCGKNNERALLTGFAVTNAAAGTFKILEEEGLCHYQMRKAPNDSWPVLQGERVVCSCPK